MSTILERFIPNVRNTVRDVNGSKTGTVLKCIFPYARHAIWNGDGGKVGATIKRIFSNTRYGVLNTFVSDLLWDYNTTRVSFNYTKHLGLLGFCGQIIPNSVNYDRISTSHQWQHHQKA